MPQLGGDRVDGFECIVLEDLFTDFVPESFLWIEFRRIGREIQEGDVVGNDEFAAAVVGRAVENQQDILSSKPAHQHI